MHEPETRTSQIDRENENLRTFQQRADAISHLIVNTDMPWVDIALMIESLRAEARRLFPQKMELFELIYANRFSRLWFQWRAA